MNTKPILFSAEMISAIQDGRKTQTRRVITKIEDWMIDHDGKTAWYEDQYGDHIKVADMCPYGKPGDLLWVRETWRTSKELDYLSPKSIEIKCRSAGYKEGPCSDIWYESDGEYRQWGSDNTEQGKRRQSIFMPRWASRITLKITGVRVERVRDISEGEARAEGVEPWSSNALDYSYYLNSFTYLWDSINEKRGYGWDKNPWVWVVEFEPIFKNVYKVIEEQNENSLHS